MTARTLRKLNIAWLDPEAVRKYQRELRAAHRRARPDLYEAAKERQRVANKSRRMGYAP